MDTTRKGIVYLTQRGVDVERSRKQLSGNTYDKLKETHQRLMPPRINEKTGQVKPAKLPPGGKTGLIDTLIVHIHRGYFTPKQRRRLGM